MIPSTARAEWCSRVDDPQLGEVLHPGVVPKFCDQQGAGGIRWSGPELGAHNAEVYVKLCGLSGDDLAKPRTAGVI